jgi:3D (Asp-Asp-Asp) domain-containing protein
MKLHISSSNWRKLGVLTVAVVAFVLLYETRMLDSTGLKAIIGAYGQPSPGSQLQFAATAYCKGTTTASGVGVRTGIAAADSTLLPVGSVLNIATGDSRYNGVYTVMDTGPKVQGRILDLYLWSCHEALRFGRREVQVTVLRLGWDPTASSPRLIDRLFKGREARRRVPPPEAPPPAGIPPEEGAGIDDSDTTDLAITAGAPAAARTAPDGPVDAAAVPAPVSATQ